MIAKISNNEPGSYQWLVERIPYVTSSNIAKVMAKGQGVTRYNYMVQKMTEHLSGVPVSGYKSSRMQDGNDNEDNGRELYALINGVFPEKRGFAYIDSERTGSSIDGDLGEGLWEHKFVITPEQVRFIDTGKIKPEYIKQMQHQMYVWDKPWCDFQSTSFGDDEYGYLPEKYQVKIQRVYRDEDMIREIREEVAFFWRDFDKLIVKFKDD